MDSEIQVLLRTVRESPGAEGEFVRLYRPRLLRASQVFLGDQLDEAGDMVQDTFLVCLPQLKNRDLSAPVFPWLRQICLRLCYARRRSRDGILTCLEDELRNYMQCMDIEPIGHPHAEVQTQQKMELLRDLIKQLAPTNRQIIQLRNVHGMTYAQIGQVLDISLSVVIERLTEARSQIRCLVKNPESP